MVNEDEFKMKICFEIFMFLIVLEGSVSINLHRYLLIIQINSRIFQIAIKCNFRYSEDVKNYPEHIIDALVERSFAIETNISKGSKEFVCEDDLDENGTTLVDFIKNRFDGTTASRETSVDDEVDSESLCCTTKKTIRPKALPSIVNNKLITVVNHGDFSQTVEIEECT